MFASEKEEAEAPLLVALPEVLGADALSVPFVPLGSDGPSLSMGLVLIWDSLEAGRYAGGGSIRAKHREFNSDGVKGTKG
jgi:hypothetical protein